MRWLAGMGCERAQGFLISRPMPAETFSEWVEHYRQFWEGRLDSLARYLENRPSPDEKETDE